MSDSKKIVDVGEVIDSAKYFWMPFGITLMMIIIMATDGYDLFLMGHVGGHIVTDWNISRADLGPINTAGLLGMAIGSVTLGWLGDRIGRKRSYFTCLVFLFIGSVLCYLAAKGGTPENATETIRQMTLLALRHGPRHGRHHAAGHDADLGVDLGARAQRHRGARDLVRAGRRIAGRVGRTIISSGSRCSWSAASCRSALFIVFGVPAAGVPEVHGAASGAASQSSRSR